MDTKPVVVQILFKGLHYTQSTGNNKFMRKIDWQRRAKKESINLTQENNKP